MDAGSKDWNEKGIDSMEQIDREEWTRRLKLKLQTQKDDEILINIYITWNHFTLFLGWDDSICKFV